jgi:DNA adenine methylase
MRQIKTPLRYPGGKSRATKILEQFLPEDWQEYREAMVGGGSFFLYLLQKHSNKQFWINDKYPELIKFWQELQCGPEKIVEYCKSIKENNDNETAREIFKNKILKQEKTASDFYFINKTSFSGLSENSSYAPKAYDQNFTISCMDKLKSISELIKNVKITNDDYNTLLTSGGEKVFIYLDPPYTIDSYLYGKKGNLHKYFDHELFAKNVKKCCHQWMVSYDDSEYVRDLFKGYRMHPWNHKYVMRTTCKKNGGVHKKGKELLILNY